MLGFLILVLAVISVWHFVVDGILSPSHMALTKVELIKTVRHLDKVKQRHGDEFNGAVYHALRSSADGLIRHMPAFSIWTIAQMKHQLATDRDLQTQVALRTKLIEECDLPAVRSVRKRLAHLAGSTLTWNTMGWAIYVFPVALAAAMYDSTSRMIKALLSMPDLQLAKLDLSPMTGFSAKR